MIGYEKYKLTHSLGFEKIPVEWDLKKVKYLFHIGRGRVISQEELMDNGLYPVFSSQTQNNGCLGYINTFDFDCDQLTWTTDGANAGTVFIRSGKHNCTNVCGTLQPITYQTNLKFSHYALQYATQFHKRPDTNGAKIMNNEMAEISFALPAECEQFKIIEYLDHETAKIDSLIAKQEKLIELLKEKRQAVISHAVTKGLNSNVPMKDSGVEWLGQVPEHWIVKRLKHISPKIGVGLVINPSTYTREDGVYFIFGGDVKEYGFDLKKTRHISKKDSDNLLPSRLNHRDLVSVRVGYPGITAVVTEELDGANCASIIVIRRGSYNSDWLCAAMNIWVGRQQVDLASYGAAQKQFNVADAIEFIFPVPPLNEQNEIASFVDNTRNNFDNLSQKAQLQIELLKERRIALISAAVTGKIDVRNWQNPNNNNEAKTEFSA